MPVPSSPTKRCLPYIQVAALLVIGLAFAGGALCDQPLGVICEDSWHGRIVWDLAKASEALDQPLALEPDRAQLERFTKGLCPVVAWTEYRGSGRQAEWVYGLKADALRE